MSVLSDWLDGFSARQRQILFQLVFACTNLLHLFVVAVICLLFYVVFVGNGAVLAFGLCACLGLAASFVRFPRLAYRIAFILVGAVVIFAVVALWVLSNPPGGANTSQAGSVITTWWQDGAYTAEGAARVWRVVAGGMVVFAISEVVRNLVAFYLPKA